MVALSQDEALLGRLFQYRFHAGRGLRGHSFGNLFLTALSHVTGDFAEAVRVSGEVLAIRGRIFPATLENVSLEAVMTDGKIVPGRNAYREKRKENPAPEPASSPRAPASRSAGSDQPSEPDFDRPRFSVHQHSAEIFWFQASPRRLKSRPRRGFWLRNLMTQRERPKDFRSPTTCASFTSTRGASLSTGLWPATSPFRFEVARRYSRRGAEPVRVDIQDLQRLGVRCLLDNLLEEHGVVRHDAARLSQLLIEEFVERRPPAR